jgi:hypothetical protein
MNILVQKFITLSREDLLPSLLETQELVDPGRKVSGEVYIQPRIFSVSSLVQQVLIAVSYPPNFPRVITQ